METQLTTVFTDPHFAWTATTFTSSDQYTLQLRPETLTELQAQKAQLQNDFDAYYVPQANHQDFPHLAEDMRVFKENYLEQGYGFGVIRGLATFSLVEQKNVYALMAAFLGTPIIQNKAKEVFIEVKDRGKTMADGARYHETAQGGSLHTDSPHFDPVPRYLGLLCYHPAQQGGESKFISAYALHNALLEKHPTLLPLLYKQHHFDKRGHEQPGEQPTRHAPIFAYDDKALSFCYLRNYIDPGHEKMHDPLSEEQFSSLDVVDQLLEDPTLMVTVDMQAGDVQFLNNLRVIHGRTDFVDYPEPEKKRILLRTWTCP